MFDSGRDTDITRGAVAGLVAGLAASALMGAFMTLAGRLMEGDRAEESSDGASEGSSDASSEASSEEAPSTERVAQTLAKAGFNYELREKERQVAGQAVHYAFGGFIGAAYGAAAEIAPAVTAGLGVPFGTAVWLGADEIALPLLDLAGPPPESPPSMHLSALSAHFIYGFCTEIGRRALREHW